MESMKDRLIILRNMEDCTQAEFSEKLKYSIDVVRNVEYGRTAPKELFIRRVCEVFHVSRTWLETGEGEMYENLAADMELSVFTTDVLMSTPEDFRKRLLTALSKLHPDDWEALERLADELTKTKKEDGDL